MDAIICATGFEVEHMLSIKIRGLDGRWLDQVWGQEPQAYREVTVADFPNLFLLLGPNSG